MLEFRRVWSAAVFAEFKGFGVLDRFAFFFAVQRDKRVAVTIGFAGLSVVDNVAVGCLDASRNVAEARHTAMAVLERLDMAQHAGNRAGSLPIGLRKRLEVAKALATRPKVLLLDEVMGGLHGSEVDEMIETVRRIHQSGVTIVLIEHVLPAVMALAEKVTVLNQGSIIATGTPREVTRDPAVIDAYLGDELVE